VTASAQATSSRPRVAAALVATIVRLAPTPPGARASEQLRRLPEAFSGDACGTGLDAIVDARNAPAAGRAADAARRPGRPLQPGRRAGPRGGPGSLFRRHAVDRELTGYRRMITGLGGLSTPMAEPELEGLVETFAAVPEMERRR